MPELKSVLLSEEADTFLSVKTALIQTIIEGKELSLKKSCTLEEDMAGLCRPAQVYFLFERFFDFLRW